jgi:hypothetical protein
VSSKATPAPAALAGNAGRERSQQPSLSAGFQNLSPRTGRQRPVIALYYRGKFGFVNQVCRPFGAILRISPDSVTARPMTTRKTTYSASHGRSSTIAPTMTRRTTGAASEGRSRTMTDDRGRTPSNANLAVFASDALRRGCLPPAAPAAAGRRRRFPFCEFRLGANDGARTFGANDHAAAGAGTARATGSTRTTPRSPNPQHGDQSDPA